MRYSCVYTQRINQRQKKFKDGFVEINQSGNGLYSIIILSEENQKLTSIKTTDEPILDGTDYQVGSYLIQVDSGSFQPQQKIGGQSFSSKGFISSSRILPSKNFPQKDYSIKVKSKMNNNKCIKQREYIRKLRDIPRTYDQIKAFYNVEVDPAFQKRNLIQRNLNDYLEP